MRLILTLVFIVLSFCKTKAQSASVYRSGALIGTYTTLREASVAASEIGDSILLSPDIFYEYEVPIAEGQIWQGTITPTDTSIIDAQLKGTVTLQTSTYRKRALLFRDIILTHGNLVSKGGYRKGGGSGLTADSVLLKGHTIIRNCHSDKNAGGIAICYAFDNVKIVNNTADSFGGGASHIIAFDSVEVAYNTAVFGGAVGFEGKGGYFSSNSHGVRVHHNTASAGGGAFYGSDITLTAGQIIYNYAPKGAAVYSTFCSTLVVQNCRIYNPLPTGKRQNEFFIQSGSVDIDGSWLGNNDTNGLFLVDPDGCSATNAVLGRPMIANWKINDGYPIDKYDTIFPVEALFTYSDYSRLPKDAWPKLEGMFSCSKGEMLSPKPNLKVSDLMQSWYRTFGAISSDTGNYPVQFLCVVDADTFLLNSKVWGRLHSKGIQSLQGVNGSEFSILMYPNPVANNLFFSGLPASTSLTIFDQQLKSISVHKIDEPSCKIDISGLASGHYFVQIRNEIGVVGSGRFEKL